MAVPLPATAGLRVDPIRRRSPEPDGVSRRRRPAVFAWAGGCSSILAVESVDREDGIDHGRERPPAPRPGGDPYRLHDRLDQREPQVAPPQPEECRAGDSSYQDNPPADAPLHCSRSNRLDRGYGHRGHAKNEREHASPKRNRSWNGTPVASHRLQSSCSARWMVPEQPSSTKPVYCWAGTPGNHVEAGGGASRRRSGCSRSTTPRS